MENVKKLINVKTIITFCLTFVFVFLAVCGKLPIENFITIYSLVIGFYFGTQKMKNEKGGSDE